MSGRSWHRLGRWHQTGLTTWQGCEGPGGGIGVLLNGAAAELCLEPGRHAMSGRRGFTQRAHVKKPSTNALRNNNLASEAAMRKLELDNKLLARQLLEEVVNTGAVERLSEFLAPACVANHTEIVGVEGFRDHLLTFHRSYPDLRVTVDGQIAEGDIVVTWWTMRGTHRGEFEGVAPTNKPITLRGVNVQRVRDGRIVEHWGGSNSLETLLDLGVVRWWRGDAF
jgi:steroid delta-isomerase-like uncharacterized protein